MITIGSSGSTILDFAPIIQALAQLLGLTALSVLGYWLQGHVKDKNTRDTILAAAENGVNQAINRINAASKNGDMSVPVASNVAAMAAKYVLQMVPGAVQHLGLDEASVVKLVIAKIPGVTGGDISDADINHIAASISGKSGTAPVATSVGDVANAMNPIIQEAVKNAIDAHYAGKPAPAPTI